MDSSPTSVQGQRCWENVEFTEGVRLAVITDELELKKRKKKNSEPTYLLIFPPNKIVGRGLLTILKSKLHFCNFPKIQSFSELGGGLCC